MIGAVVGLILLVALLGVMFYCARVLLPLISLVSRVLIILLVTIIALFTGKSSQPPRPRVMRGVPRGPTCTTPRVVRTVFGKDWFVPQIKCAAELGDGFIAIIWHRSDGRIRSSNRLLRIYDY